MKTAIFHNFLDNIGGAEMVTLILARNLNADIYTTNIDHDKIAKMGFNSEKIFSIGKIPINAPFRQQAALCRFRHLNLKDKYDFFIIAGDWAMSGAINNKPNLWYVHSPIREIWDLYQYTRQHTVPFLLRPIFDIWTIYNRKLNKQYIQHVDQIACNSMNTCKRVNNYLNRDATIIHPPIETSRHSCQESKGYWLSVNRLISHKRVDIQMKAFSKLPEEKLIVVGSYEKSRHFTSYAKYIQSIKPDNVEIKSWVAADELCELYNHCKGFITTSADEDFGMAPVEAMASGKPVIAPFEGGYKETITDKTGIFLKEPTPDCLLNSIEIINQNLHANLDFYRKACLLQATKFDSERFIEKIKSIIPAKQQKI